MARIIERETEVQPEPEERAAVQANSVINFIVGIITLLLGLRFILLLFGANAANGFVNFVYGLTEPLVAPFQGIFGPLSAEGFFVDWASIIAIIVYVVIGSLISSLVNTLLMPTPRTR